MVSNHEVSDTRNFLTQLMQFPHGPTTPGQSMSTRRIIPTEQHQNNINLPRMHHNEEHFMLQAGTASRGPLRYAPSFDVTTMRQRQQSAAMGGNPLRINMNGSNRLNGTRVIAESTFRNLDDAKKQILHMDSAAGKVNPEKQILKKEIASNTVIEISDDNDNPSEPSGSRKRGRESEQNTSSAKKKVRDPNNSPAAEHDELFDQVLLELESDPGRLSENQSQISTFIKSDFSISEDIVGLAGPFVQGVVSNDEKVVKCALSDECRGLKEIIKKRVEEEIKKIMVVSDSKSINEGDYLADPTTKAEMQNMVLSNEETSTNLCIAAPPADSAGTKNDVLCEKNKVGEELEGNLFDEKTNGIHKKFMICGTDIENIVTAIITKDVDNAIVTALKNVAQRAVKIAYVEVKNRHSAIISRDKIPSAEVAEESVMVCNNVENHSKLAHGLNLLDNNICETINEVKEKHASNLKSSQENQKETIDRLVARHKEEMLKLKRDNARMLKCALLAGSHALKTVRGDTG